MLPLTLARTGEEIEIKRIGGSAEVKRHLENLGFVVGERVSVLLVNEGNLIVRVKESRIAISREMAAEIMIVYSEAASAI